MDVWIIGPEDAVLAHATHDVVTGPRVGIPRVGEVAVVDGRRYRVREVDWEIDPVCLTKSCRIWVEVIDAA